MEHISLSPRASCLAYEVSGLVFEKSKLVLLVKEDFDSHCTKHDFVEGPFLDSFGDGYGEPYNPFRQAYGELKSGERVYCEVHKGLDKRVRESIKKNLNKGKS